MKKQFKTLIVLSVVVAMIFAFTSCADKPTEKAEEAVTKAFTALQSGDIEGAGKYMNTVDLKKNADLDFSENDLEKEQMLAIMKAFFTNLNYEILSSEEKKDGTVQVEAKISNVDMEEVVAKWVTEILVIGLKYSASGDTSEETEKKATQEMVDSLENCVRNAVEDKKFKEGTTTLKVKETDDGWKLDLDKDQMDLILGGFTEAVNNLSV